MSGRSSIAEHPQNADIRAALLAGISLRTIAAQFGVSKSTLIRYRNSLAAQPSEQTAPCESVSQESASETPDCHCASPHIEPPDTMLRNVAGLLAQGYTHQEIAARYGVSVDRVAACQQEIRTRTLAVARSTSATDFVARLLHNSECRSQALWRLQNEAMAPRRHKALIATIDSLRREDQHILTMAAGLGVLSQFRVERSTEPQSDMARMARALIEDLSRLDHSDAGGVLDMTVSNAAAEEMPHREEDGPADP